jgi:hypothetical protein
MEIYMAGGISGNCKPLWTDLIKAERSNKLDIYLAGLNGRRWCVDLYLAGHCEPYVTYQTMAQDHSIDKKDEKMDIYLAGTMYGNQANFMKETENEIPKMIDLSILESFYYADEWTEWAIPRLKKFMLDSGAFTFMTSHKGKVDWNDYLKRYAEFINKNDVKLFYELDIDSIVGYETVLQMRKYLERETGKKPIPVWHKSRGKAEFLKMCEQYDYVAIGGIVSKEITRQDYKYFPIFINEAHKRGCKIHGLGFTNLEGITKYHFDSVDSTSWTTGNRFGAIYRFNGTTMEKFSKKPGQRLADSRAVAIHNFNEWAKFQQYARTNL